MSDDDRWHGSIRRGVRRLLRVTPGRAGLRRSIDEEISAHLELRTEQLVARGMSPDDARTEALRRFAGETGFYEALERLHYSAERREGRMRVREQLDSIAKDIRYGWRGLRRQPGFSAAAVLTVALCVGANTAMFGVVNAVLLQPLPYASADRLVMVWNHWTNWPQTWLSPPEAADYAKQREALADLAPYNTGATNLSGDGEPERVRAGQIPANFLTTVGVTPIAGRNFTKEEDQPNGPAAVLLDYGLWQRRYAGDRGVVGRSISLSGVPTTVVGILPEAFRLPDEFAGEHAQLYRPLRLGPVDPNQRGGHYLLAVARLAPGVTVGQANAQIAAFIERFKKENLNIYNADFGTTFVPMPDQILGGSRAVLYLLLAAVGFVLVIGCANVASLLLSRAESRQREIAVRAALGAGRQRLARQFLTESLMIGLAGGVLALPLAAWGGPLLVGIGSRQLPRGDALQVDARVLGFTLVVAVLTSLLFGLAPVVHALRGDLQSSLRQGRQGANAGGGLRIRQFIVTTQIALAVMSVAGAALMLRSFSTLRAVSPGFRPDHVLTMRLSLPPVKYRGNDVVHNFYADLLTRVRALPGVRAAGAINAMPLTGTIGDWSVLIDGRPQPQPGKQGPAFDWQVATPGYFESMGIAIKQGRAITAADSRSGQQVMVISEATAKQYWPNASPLGARVKLGGPDSLWREVVGVAADVHHSALDKNVRAEMYLPHGQFPNSAQDSAGASYAMTLTIRTANDPSAITNAVRGVLRQMDAQLPVAQVRTLESIVLDSVSTPRLATILLATFAGLALVLSAIGVYGVMAYSVARRTGEIGIRMALGARSSDVMRLVIRQGMQPAVLGLVLGVIAALSSASLIRGLVYGISPTDRVSIIAAVVVLGSVALAATTIPARRVTRVDPTAALRGE